MSLPRPSIVSLVLAALCVTACGGGADLPVRTIDVSADIAAAFDGDPGGDPADIDADASPNADEGVPRIGCEAGVPPAMELARFGRTDEPWPDGEDIPVWRPSQGGIVVGFNVAAAGVTDKARRVETLLEVEGRDPLAIDELKGVRFRCYEARVRLLTQYMVTLERGLKVQDLLGLDATLTVKVTFPSPEEDGEDVVLTVRHRGILADVTE